MAQRPPNIALIGMMGSGKSTIGRVLADRLGWTFVDTDSVIVTQQVREIAEIFATDGEPWFRDLETAAVTAAVAFAERVIATGGGAILREENREAIWGRCWVVWLTATPEEHARRVSLTEHRPVLARYRDPVDGARLVLAERERFYAKAHHVEDTTSRTVEDVVTGILRAWDSLGNG